MRNKIYAFCLIMLGSLNVTPSRSETLLQCGASAGWSYFIADGVVEENEQGWEKDAISNGFIALSRDREGNFDLLFRDTFGIKSASSYGAQVLLLGVGEKTISLLVRYAPTVFEIYSFDTLGLRVMWSQHKLEQPVSKAATFVAECK